MFKSYILQNWILILILSAFVTILLTTAFLDKKATRRMYILIAAVFVLSIIVFIPALILLIIDIVSIFTGIVFKLSDSNELVRGPLGYLPFIVVGLYFVLLIDKIRKSVVETKYSVSIGYNYQKDGFKDLDELLKASDEQMYLDKAEYYKTHQK